VTDQIDTSPEAVERFSSYSVMMSLEYGKYLTSSNGEWVRYDDYAVLSARIAELEAKQRETHRDRDKWFGLALDNKHRIEELEAERDEQSERIEELQQACEVVSSEFEGELWQACRYLLGKTHFDFSEANVDGIQAADFQDHMNETLAEFDRAMGRIAELEAKLTKLVEAVTHQREMVCQDFGMQLQAIKSVDDALAEIKGEPS